MICAGVKVVAMIDTEDGSLGPLNADVLCATEEGFLARIMIPDGASVRGILDCVKPGCVGSTLDVSVGTFELPAEVEPIEGLSVALFEFRRPESKPECVHPPAEDIADAHGTESIEEASSPEETPPMAGIPVSMNADPPETVAGFPLTTPANATLDQPEAS